VIVVLASVAGVLAAIGPARRAAKLAILGAIASE
jgi:ABC-type antimicrobial peptide transport system permease subunit